MYHFPLVVCSNDVSVLHLFRDITTVIMYNVTACDLEKSLVSVSIVEITGQVRIAIYVQT